MIINRTIILLKKLFIKLSFSLLLAYFFLIGIGLSYSDNLIFLPPSVSYQFSDDLVTIPSKDSTDPDAEHFIVARLLHNPEAKYTIIYSHGNAVDIGGLIHLQQNLFNHGYSVIIYDYSGYGLSEGSVSEQQVYNDVQAVYHYLIEQKNLKPEQIISYGHSLGAAIATDLAFSQPVAGLILESPFVTAFRVKTVYQLVPFDKFSSIEKIDKINTPVFITHARDDNIIPFWHSEALLKKAHTPKTKLWLEKAGHAGITHTNLFWPRLETFIAEINPDEY